MSEVVTVVVGDGRDARPCVSTGITRPNMSNISTRMVSPDPFRLSKQNTHLAPQGGAKNGLAEVNIPARNPTPEIRGYLYGKPGMEPIVKAHGEKEM